MEKKHTLWKFALGLFLIIGAGGQRPMDAVDFIGVLAGLALVGWGVLGLIRKRGPAQPAAMPNEKAAAAEADPIDVEYPFTRMSDGEAVRLKDYVVIDTETTGFSPRDDKIIEVGAYKIRGGEVSRFHSLVDPGRRIPKRAVNVHHITDADVAQAPAFAQIRPELDAFLEDLPVVGQSVHFDLRMLWWAYHDAGADLPAKQYVDTARLAKKIWPGRQSYSLASLITDLHLIEGEQVHRSESDVDATLALYRLCCEQWTK